MKQTVYLGINPSVASMDVLHANIFPRRMLDILQDHEPSLAIEIYNPQYRYKSWIFKLLEAKLPGPSHLLYLDGNWIL
jgi:hypothetical protein